MPMLLRPICRALASAGGSPATTPGPSTSPPPACLGPTRAHAYAVYGFCRWADDGVDSARDRTEAADRLDHAREALDLAYSDRAPRPARPACVSPDRRARSIPRELFRGPARRDGDGPRHHPLRRHSPSLDRYCYRVAGVVGLMMTHVFGYRSDSLFAQRPEHWARPCSSPTSSATWPTTSGWAGSTSLGTRWPGSASTRQQIAGRAGRRRASATSMRFQVDRARRYYEESEAGIP